MSAAVSDWKVIGKKRQKIKKKKTLNLGLALNPDILTYVSRLKKQGKTKKIYYWLDSLLIQRI